MIQNNNRKWLSKHASNRNMQHMVLQTECVQRGTKENENLEIRAHF